MEVLTSGVLGKEFKRINSLARNTLAGKLILFDKTPVVFEKDLGFGCISFRLRVWYPLHPNEFIFDFRRTLGVVLVLKADASEAVPKYKSIENLTLEGHV